MGDTAVSAYQDCQTMAKSLTRLTYRTLIEPKTHALFKTIIMFTHKRTLTRGKQTIVTKSSISNDSRAQTAKLKLNASTRRSLQHAKSTLNRYDQLIVAREQNQLDVDRYSSFSIPTHCAPVKKK